MSASRPTLAHAAGRSRRLRRGDSLISVLMGILIGSLVIGGFLMFLLGADDAKQHAADRTEKQSMGLAALNRIAADVSEAAALAHADEDKLVLDLRDDDGNVTRVGWGVETEEASCAAAGQEAPCLYRATVKNAPKAFSDTAAANPTYDTVVPDTSVERRRDYLTEDVRPVSNGVPLFTFVEDAGTPVPVPADNPGDAEAVKRVDIAFVADSGDGSVELRTSASLGTGPGGVVDPDVPACPLPTFESADPDVRLQWNITGQTTKYEIYRENSAGGWDLVGQPVADDDSVAQSWGDTWTIATWAQMTGSWNDGVQYRVDAVNENATDPANRRSVLRRSADGTVVDCPSITWWPKIDKPQATVELTPNVTPAGNVQSAWGATPGSASASPQVRVSWPQVSGALAGQNANGYQVYVSNSALPRGATSSATTSFGSYVGFISRTSGYCNASTCAVNIGQDWDSTYAYYVVATGPMPEPSGATDTAFVLSHPRPPTEVDPDLTEIVDRASNTVTWTDDPGPTADGYVVMRRETSTNQKSQNDVNGDGRGGYGTSCFPGEQNWAPVSGALPLTQTTWVDTGAKPSTYYEYAVVAYNDGTRGRTQTGQTVGASSIISNRQHGHLSRSDKVLQYPGVPYDRATGSTTSPSNSSGGNRSALTSGFTAGGNVGYNVVEWESLCARTGYDSDGRPLEERFTVTAYRPGNSSTGSMYALGANIAPWTDKAWAAPGTERKYKVVAYNDLGASTNASASTGNPPTGFAYAYQYSQQPGVGSVSANRYTTSDYMAYTDDNIRPSSLPSSYSCWSSPVDVDDSYWEGRWEQEWVPPTYKQERYWYDTSHSANGHGTFTMHGHAPTAGPHWHSHGEWRYRQVVDQPGYYKDVWNPQYKWHPDSDGDLEDYAWYCTRWVGGYSASWSENADGGESANPFCSAGRGGCQATVYYRETTPWVTDADREWTSSGNGGFSNSANWYSYYSPNSHDMRYAVAGPQGTISCNAGGCNTSAQATYCPPSIAGCTPSATPFVGAPDFTVVGSDRSAPLDRAATPNRYSNAEAAGSNLVSWDAVTGASNYRIYAYTTYSNGRVDLGSRSLLTTTGGSTSGCSTGFNRCWTDSGRPAGTERYYVVAAVDGTGASIDSGVPLAAYQIPATTGHSFTITQAPTLSSNQVILTWTRIGDVGMAANAKFCATGRGNCRYEIEAYNTTTNKVDKVTKLGPNANTATVNQTGGITVRYHLRVCNDGGCVRIAAPATTPSWPDVMSIRIANDTMLRETYGERWFDNVNQAAYRKRNWARATPAWSSAGDVTYRIGRRPLTDTSADPHARRFPAGYSNTKASAFDNAKNLAWPTDTLDKMRVTPGYRYEHRLWATGVNGLERDQTFTVLSPPSHLPFHEGARACKVPWNDRMKPIYRFKKSGWSDGQQTRMNRIRFAWMAFAFTRADLNAIANSSSPTARGEYAYSQKFWPYVRRINNGNFDEPLTKLGSGDWMRTPWYDGNKLFYDFSNYTNGGFVTGGMDTFLLGDQDDKITMPVDNEYGQAVFQWWTTVNVSGPFDAGNDQRPSGIQHEESTDSLGVACPASNTAWRYDGGSYRVGRWATQGSTGAGDARESTGSGRIYNQSPANVPFGSLVE